MEGFVSTGSRSLSLLYDFLTLAFRMRSCLIFWTVDGLVYGFAFVQRNYPCDDMCHRVVWLVLRRNLF